MAASRTDSRRRGPVAGPRGKRSRKTKFKIFLLWTVIFGSLGFLVGWWEWRGALVEAEALMPQIETKLEAMKIKPSTIMSADGHVLYSGSSTNRTSVKLADIPEPGRKRITDAIIAAEDRRFYEHHGVDFTALARVAFLTGKEGRIGQGGSTLTMQLAKRMHSAGERTWRRKLLDMAIARQMEDEWSKDKILELYLNEVYFGSGAYGIESAAETYFAKPAAKLTLGEAAMLARCVRRPADENPFKDPKKAKENRDLVLGIMHTDGQITDQQFEDAKAEKVKLNPKRRDEEGLGAAPWIVTSVMAELKERCPDLHFSDGGIVVETTINWDMQMAAEDAVHHVVANHAKDLVNNAAFVLMTGDGRILAEVGGANFKKNQFNVVTQGHRQPGSSMKPFVYAKAFVDGKLDLNSSISNERFVVTDASTGKTWSPRNDNGKYGGMVSIHTAVALSINTPAVRTLVDLGIPSFVQFAKDTFGFTSDLPEFPSLALGACSVSPLEMAQAYAVFANRGSRPTPFLVNRVVSADGTIEEENNPKMASNVLQTYVCDDINTLLRGVVTGGTGTRASGVPDARGKTGTTSDNKDAWFCGAANGLIGVGWVGHDVYSKRLKSYVPEPMAHSVFGGTVTVQMWAEVEQAAFDKFGTKYQVSEGQNDGTRPAPGTEKALDEKGDPAIPVDGTIPSANGSPDQKMPPAGNDPGVTLSGQDPNHTSVSLPPPPDPTLAEPKNDPPPVTPVRAPTRQHPHTRASSSHEVEYVDVEICADTGELATDYCPETVTRRFVKGHEPKRHCHTHRG